MHDDFIRAEMPGLGEISLRRTVPRASDPKQVQSAQDLVCWHCHRQWSRPRPENGTPALVASQDERFCHIDGVAVRRLVVTLRPVGCGWGSRGGGCVMCGH